MVKAYQCRKQILKLLITQIFFFFETPAVEPEVHHPVLEKADTIITLINTNDYLNYFERLSLMENEDEWLRERLMFKLNFSGVEVI